MCCCLLVQFLQSISLSQGSSFGQVLAVAICVLGSHSWYTVHNYCLCLTADVSGDGSVYGGVELSNTESDLWEPACNRLAHCLERAAEVGGGKIQAFAPGPRTLRLGCPTGELVTHLLVCSVQLQPVPQRVKEI